jgi:hypothetical protein
MAYWLITPATGADDPRWQDRKRWPEVIVRADSAAAARLAARELESAGKGPPSGNEWPSGRSGFDDEKLYLVRQIEPSGDLMLAFHGEGVVSAIWPTDVGR